MQLLSLVDVLSASSSSFLHMLLDVYVAEMSQTFLGTLIHAAFRTHSARKANTPNTLYFRAYKLRLHSDIFMLLGGEYVSGTVIYIAFRTYSAKKPNCRSETL